MHNNLPLPPINYQGARQATGPAAVSGGGVAARRSPLLQHMQQNAREPCRAAAQQRPVSIFSTTNSRMRMPRLLFFLTVTYT
jgi:hypothetical protein